MNDNTPLKYLKVTKILTQQDNNNKLTDCIDSLIDDLGIDPRELTESWTLQLNFRELNPKWLVLQEERRIATNAAARARTKAKQGVNKYS